MTALLAAAVDRIDVYAEDVRIYPDELPELPDGHWLITLAVVALLALYFLRRIARRFRRRERETMERAIWAQSGYYPTTRIFRKWRHGHRSRRNR